MNFTDFSQYETDSSLQELELLFKQVYKEYPDRFLANPHVKNDISDILCYIAEHSTHFLPKMILESLDEEVFFSADTDVSIYQHVRYMPTLFHQHDFFEIACVLDGHPTNYIVNQEVSMYPGDICIIAPDTTHAISAFSDDCLILNILLRTSTFEKSFLHILSEKDILSDFFIRTLYQSKEMPYLLFKTGSDTEIHNYIGYLYNEINRNRRYKKRMVNTILNAFFITLLRNHDKDVLIPSLHTGKCDENIIFLLRYMQENYKTVTLSHLADFFNFSERHIQRMIKSTTTLSFTENIQKIKMNHAAELLIQQNIPVTEIALQQGYSDASNFRHVFKKYYGITPIEYRKQYKTE